MGGAGKRYVMPKLRRTPVYLVFPVGVDWSAAAVAVMPIWPDVQILSTKVLKFRI